MKSEGMKSESKTAQCFTKLQFDLNGNIEEKSEQNKKEYTEQNLVPRLIFYGVNFAVLTIVTFDLLRRDFSSLTDDPRVAYVDGIKFRYATVWNYIFFGFYLGIAFIDDYLHWIEKWNFRIITDVRHFLMTAFTATSTFYVCTFFWIVWTYDRELIVPSYQDVLLTKLHQHCLHTVTLITVLVDLAIVPRFRPVNDSIEKFVSFAIMISYHAVVLWTFIEKEIWIYPFLKDMSSTKWMLFITYNFVSWKYFYRFQWWYINRFWKESGCHSNKVK